MIEPRLPEEINLAPLETFDPKAFIDPDPSIQLVCDFVLALGLLFNDLNDLICGHYLLRKDQPDIKHFFESPKWGMYNGLDIHIFRRKVAMLHELGELLRGSQREMAHPIFQDLIARLEKDNPKFTWTAVKNPPSSVSDFLKGIRDKVSNHYFYKDRNGQSAIGEGYRQFFKDKRPYLSHGRNTLGMRLYFLDAAVVSLMLIRNWREVDPQVDEHLTGVCYCLSGIVIGFIVMRGYKIEPVTNQS